ncbi:unnamed protein product [Rhizoctonia solani]|uniref:Uncharacterized protein n=1 Tax=Rhizoctonia solani TaxID=456999 RepID=A0A8H2XD63_9AGAM|nr:unnamed protein product [Rhizoctonia solani]
MPTYAGYMMRPKDQLAWLRREHPEIEADEHNIPINGPLYARLRKFGLLDVFTVLPVMIPQKPGTILDHECLEDMGIMFARRIRLTGKPAWLPPREIPGSVSDTKAGIILKRLGFNVSSWAIVYQPMDDPVSSHYVSCPIRSDA